MGIWAKPEVSRISRFRRLQLENWRQQLEARIARAQAQGDDRLLAALLSERQYLERCR
ncbi:hypothetical protein [Gloeobacter kilaueensis]|uniref:Uncharacterized protein n=1 Tax=Gloeobacter kilaueensis (strain ATCC BAA-2537 / CCAP 1431/1 / ULC 316 / JS1) TaxID=1183438 RepID=U5QLD2_GLOK1|nr:hypothetical protein [Gloeobacter kilaueensis]AGY59741.1 hypothetical protein GKIL_3495 [Gloeobacter kilaueensis JS1]